MGSAALPDPETLLELYGAGVFPMAESRESDRIIWCDPERRGIIPLEGFHLPHRLRRRLKARPYRFALNSAFSQVLAACAAPAPGREDSWINAPIADLYGALHKGGHAHSIECWDGDFLAGGLYGVGLGAAFFAESMVTLRPDASKLALVHLAARLRAGGFRLLDVQFLTPHLRRFGAVEVSRKAYHRRLKEAVVGRGDFYSLPSDPDPETLLQSISQTS